MSDLEEQPGYVDLKDADFLLQAHAVARARCFFEASQSGPASLALAQGVPTARCNAVDLRCISKDQGIIVPQRFIHRSGKDLTRLLIETEQLDIRAIQDHPDLHYQLVDVSVLLDALDRILEMTENASTGWRSDTPAPSPPPIAGFYPGKEQPFRASVMR